MANQAEIAETYDYMDAIIRINLGEFPDISCAFYNGDYSQTLQQAQEAKHRYILDSLDFRPGMRVLDVGSGWGPMMKAVNDAGGHAVGLTLSPAQFRWCQRNGFETYLKDWKEMTANEYGVFGGVVSVGAFEHFCSVEEYLQGKQDEVYSDFFGLCWDVLPKGGRLFLQTMVCGKNWPGYGDISLNAPKVSNEYLVALLGEFYPGSWLPSDKEQISKNTRRFKLISANNGRLDYVQTLKEWGVRSRRITLQKIWAVAKLGKRYVTSKEFRYKVEAFRRAATRTCFEREILNHYRMVFEKL